MFRGEEAGLSDACLVFLVTRRTGNARPDRGRERAPSHSARERDSVITDRFPLDAASKAGELPDAAVIPVFGAPIEGTAGSDLIFGTESADVIGGVAAATRYARTRAPT